MKEDTRFRRAWREAGWPAWIVRLASVIVGGVIALYGAYLRHVKPEALANIAFGVAASLGGLVVVHIVVYLRTLRRVSRRMAEEAIPLCEVRRVISEDVRVHGPQAISLGGTMEHYGVPFTQEHIAALRTLQANGEVGTVRFRVGYDTDTGGPFLDATVQTTRVLDG